MSSGPSVPPPGKSMRVAAKKVVVQPPHAERESSAAASSPSIHSSWLPARERSNSPLPVDFPPPLVVKHTLDTASIAGVVTLEGVTPTMGFPPDPVPSASGEMAALLLRVVRLENEVASHRWELLELHNINPLEVAMTELCRSMGERFANLEVMYDDFGVRLHAGKPAELFDINLNTNKSR